MRSRTSSRSRASVRGAFEAYDRGDLRTAISAGSNRRLAAGRAAFDVYYYLGSAYLKLGQAERAVAPLREASGRNAGLHALVPRARDGATCSWNARTRRRRSFARRSINDPRSFQLHSTWATSARLRRDLPTARQEYEAARTLNPRDFDVRMNLSSIYRDAGDASRALAEVDAALEDAARTRPMRTTSGACCSAGPGRFREAAGAFERATALSSRNAQFWFNLGLARFRAGDRPRAAEALRGRSR